MIALDTVHIPCGKSHLTYGRSDAQMLAYRTPRGEVGASIYARALPALSRLRPSCTRCAAIWEEKRREDAAS